MWGVFMGEKIAAEKIYKPTIAAKKTVGHVAAWVLAWLIAGRVPGIQPADRRNVAVGIFGAFQFCRNTIKQIFPKTAKYF